jgi:phosphatidylethanolamine-binding protein (PEBP) family uncharacterized protein
MNKFRKITSLLIASAVLFCAGCSGKPSDPASASEPQISASEDTDETTAGNAIGRYLEGRNTFEVTSEDLVDGVWIDVISKTDIGENQSPQLSWSPVEGASVYVIYMVDSNTNGFLHWKSNDITETDLPRGWASAVDYAGPHIGHGYTHTFDIYVMALKSPVGRLKGAVNAVNKELSSFIELVDTDENGNTGNIISYGRISGEFTDSRFRGDRTVDENKPYYM